MPKIPKSTSKMVRVLVQLPKPMKAALDSLKDEGYTASSFIRFLVRENLRARRETGWVQGKGWINWDKRPGAEEVRHAEELHRKERERRQQAEKTGTHG